MWHKKVLAEWSLQTLFLHCVHARVVFLSRFLGQNEHLDACNCSGALFSFAISSGANLAIVNLISVPILVLFLYRWIMFSRTIFFPSDSRNCLLASITLFDTVPFLSSHILKALMPAISSKCPNKTIGHRLVPRIVEYSLAILSVQSTPPWVWL